MKNDFLNNREEIENILNYITTDEYKQYINTLTKKGNKLAYISIFISLSISFWLYLFFTFLICKSPGSLGVVGSLLAMIPVLFCLVVFFILIFIIYIIGETIIENNYKTKYKLKYTKRDVEKVLELFNTKEENNNE